MSADDARVASARFAWDDGARQLAPRLADGGNRARLVDAIHDELRRRVGATFRVGELVEVYEGASGWYLELASRIAPGDPESWEPSVTMDGAFGLYQRFAVDVNL